MTKKAIMQIIKDEDEIEAVKFLIFKLENDMAALQKDNAHNKACLKAIKKINAGKDKDIDSLCE